MVKNTTVLALVNQLRAIVNHYGSDWITSKKKLLQILSQESMKDVPALLEYHDCLLFLLAYPENKELYNAARQELVRIANQVRELMLGKNAGIHSRLSGTGIVWTTQHVAFSFNMAKWLVTRYPDHTTILECDATADLVKSVFSLLVPKAESFAWEDHEFDFEKWIQYLKGDDTGSFLDWLIHQFQFADCTNEIRDHLYDSLKLYVSWSLNDQMPSRTFARAPERKIFFHKKSLIKQPDASRVIRKEINAQVNISKKQKIELIETARGILCSLLRETDPVTYADTPTVELHSMGRGIDIALFSMIPERRLPFDSYIGYIEFKNRLPVAYGGGWIFQQCSKIGINVLEPYRGGESAYLFCQILRLYHHHFSVNRFIVEPYQIGKKNAEGLQSGAFWFYYRLGFRPVKDEVKLLAETEFAKILADKKYRSPIAVMRKLSGANLELVITEGTYHQVDVSLLSESITQLIIHRFEGNRKTATDWATNFGLEFLNIKNLFEWSKVELESLQNFTLLLSAFENISDWSNADRLACTSLIKEKGSGHEKTYISKFQKHRKLNEAIKNLATMMKSL